MDAKQAIITGGAGGLGRATTDYLVNKGWHVFAADFDKAALGELYPSEGITPLYIDVRDAQSVREAREAVEKHTNRLDAIINFAGILAVGSMIEIDEATMRRIFDVNVMGTYNVNKAFFPLVRKSNGRFVNIGSETGWQSAAPFNGLYAMTKHAIEAYSDALRREMAFFGIPVIKIQPGPFKTEMTQGIEHAFDAAAEQSTLFKEILLKLKELAVEEGKKASHPDILAKAVYEALTENPKAAYSVKPDPARSVLEYLPTRTADWLMKTVLRQYLR